RLLSRYSLPKAYSLDLKNRDPCICPACFFSSRRRHTRWPRDWSSDVCSSDLVDPPRQQRTWTSGEPVSPSLVACPAMISFLSTRSEERRVGKECSSCWSRYH